MAQEYRTKCFIYKKRNVGEADRIFTVFSWDFGKLEIFAKGIRKIDSKLKSGIDIFFLCDIEFVQGKRKTLTDTVLIEKFKNINQAPEKFLISRKIAEVLDNFILGQEHDHEIFNLLIEIFSRLNHYTLTLKSYSLVYLFFVWNFFKILGYEPQLYNCSHCHGKLDEDNLFFSYEDGGILCQKCMPHEVPLRQGFSGTKWGGKIVVNSDIIKMLRIILKQDWNILKKLKFSDEMQKDLNNISKNYYLYLLSFHSFKKI